MTKKHFEAIAAVLKSTKPHGALGRKHAEKYQWSTMVRAMADMCAAQNAQFKRELFYRACGLES